jgi:hypothetical protein
MTARDRFPHQAVGSRVSDPGIFTCDRLLQACYAALVAGRTRARADGVW